jgi:hypothetical protein
MQLVVRRDSEEHRKHGKYTEDAEKRKIILEFFCAFCGISVLSVFLLVFD